MGADFALGRQWLSVACCRQILLHRTHNPQSDGGVCSGDSRKMNWQKILLTDSSGHFSFHDYKVRRKRIFLRDWISVFCFQVSWYHSSQVILTILGDSILLFNKREIGGGNRRGISSVQFSRSVVSDSLRPHESQHARPPCPSPTPGVHPDSRPSSQWCHPAISSSVVPFSSCPQSLPASESFPVSQLFTWGGQSIGASASAPVLPMNTQD